jgi:RHS repeat-associated protein
MPLLKHQPPHRARPRAGSKNRARRLDPVSQASCVVSSHRNCSNGQYPSQIKLQNLNRNYDSNQQYSITAVSDGGGAIVERYAYSAYGQVTIADASGSLISSSAIANRYTFTGREWDEGLSQYHNRARMYDAVAGRFVSRDPIGYEDGVGLYVALGHNPLDHSDPSGLAKVSGTIAFDAARHTKRRVRNGYFKLTLDYSFDIECDGNGGYVINQAPTVDGVGANWYPDWIGKVPVAKGVVTWGYDARVTSHISDLGCPKPKEQCIRIDLMFSPYSYVEIFKMFGQLKPGLRSETPLDTWGHPIRVVYDLRCCCHNEAGPSLVLKQWTEASLFGVLSGKNFGRVAGGMVLCGDQAPDRAPRQKARDYSW